jgi:hypothetical protein
MGFWQFGREPDDIEIATRVITAATQNGYTIRGKLTIHFAEPQRQTDADAAADRCAQVAIALLREAQTHERVIGAEAQISTTLFGRYPIDVARARAVEVAALHVVGDPALSDELRRASTGMPASIPQPSIKIPSSQPGRTPRSDPPPLSVGGGPASYANPPGSVGPPLSGQPVSRRRGSTQLRSIQSMLMPPGTPPSGMGAYIAPIVRDSAARLLIGFLRAHDLITLRGVAIDANSAEALATLVPAADAPPGGYEASRATELSRWQATLGADVVTALHRETSAVSAYLARETMLHADISRTLAVAVVEATCATAFPNKVGLFEELDRFPDALSTPTPPWPPCPSPALVSAVAERLSAIADAGDDPVTMAAALTPLVSVIQEDLNVSAMIIKQSSS